MLKQKIKKEGMGIQSLTATDKLTHFNINNMTDKQIQGDEKDNSLIVAQIFADEVKQAKAKRYPSAQDIIEEMKQ